MEAVQNTLYVTTAPSYLHLDHDTLVLEQNGTTLKSLPLLAFESIVLFGDVMISPAFVRRCAEDGRTITLLEHTGAFRARIEGPVSGNVLLRRAQYEALSSPDKSLDLAKSFVAGKLQNTRLNLLRAARESQVEADQQILSSAGAALAESLRNLKSVSDIARLRGLEGDAARQAFQAFSAMVLVDRETFGITTRSRRPPLDPTNALLSYLYTLLTHDCRCALEGVGLDPQAGFLHALRPGRPALALDLMEELRPILGDRLALTLINRRQITPDDFITRPGGATVFMDDSRKTVITAYVERKREEIMHSVLGKKVPISLIPHMQARLLARTVRGELAHYPPFCNR